MLPADLLRQIRRLKLRARRVVRTLLGGEYHSAFKGVGLSFEEVREYQPGDDIRSIDWNVTARMGHPFIKRYVEERELTILLAIDVSASQLFGTGSHAKSAVAAELAAVLTFCAVANNDRVGLLLFSDVIEKYVHPSKGNQHAMRLLRDVLYFQPNQPRTCLTSALDHLCKVHRRRAIAFVISDFLDSGFDDAFRRTARKHDLIAIRTSDPSERDWPNVGLMQLEDAETGQQMLVDSSAADLRSAFASAQKEREDAFAKLCRTGNADRIDVSTDGQHFDALLRFFQLRERRHRRGR